MSIKNINEELLKWYMNEATDSGSRGDYRVPLSSGTRLWDKKNLSPFEKNVSKYDNAELQYDSYDGKLDVSKKKAQKMEKKSRKIEKYLKKHPIRNDDDGDILTGNRGKLGDSSPYSKKVNEASDSIMTSGEYNVPLEHGLRKFKKTALSPFDIEVEHIHTHHAKNNELDDLIVHHIKSLTEEKVNEDLAVWFGTKKKPKGSKQPKGPWVNICRKKEGGGHPPCGRPEASDRGYPKCRAAGVAAKMTDAQKKSACAQKRRAEKSNPKSGKGNKPKMVSYKPKKESTREQIKNIIKEYLSSKSV